MRQYEVRPLPGHDPVIGSWLWAMQEVRRRRLSLVEGLDERFLDWEGPDGRENAIGNLLYHIAEVEMAWLWGAIKGRTQMPPEEFREFPIEPVDRDTGWLSRTRGVPLAEHLRRLGSCREVFLGEVRGLSPDYWRTMRWTRRTSPWRSHRSGCCFTWWHMKWSTTSRSPR